MDLSSISLTAKNLKLVESSILNEAVRSVLESSGREDLYGHIISIKRHEDRVTIKTKQPIINQELSHYSSKISAELYKKAHSFLPEVKKFIVQLI